MSTTASGGWFGASARMAAPSGGPVVTNAGPPADRMQGRPSRSAMAARAAAAKPAAPMQTHAARESLLDRAELCGVISSGLRSHYAAAYDADPAGTRAFLASVGLRGEAAPSAGPTAAASAASSEDYGEGMLTHSERARVTAAREGRPHARIVHGG